MPRLAPVIKTVFCAMFTLISQWGRPWLGLAGPFLASLLGKTGGDVKTHRCLGDFFFLSGFPPQRCPETL